MIIKLINLMSTHIFSDLLCLLVSSNEHLCTVVFKVTLLSEKTSTLKFISSKSNLHSE